MRRRIIILVLAGVIIFAISSRVLSQNEKKKEDIYKQVEIFSSALSIVQSDYVDDTSAKNLIYGALKGMLASLDPYSQFMDPETYNELKVDTEGKFGGLGIEITSKDGLLTVVTPIEDTPAWKAGVKAGDRIVKINDDITRDMTLTDAVKKLRGAPGQAVNITILRESEKRLIDFKIVRDLIRIKDIKDAKILEDGIGYVRLVEFRENTANDLRSTLENLKKNGMTMFILDLRNNPGGLLDVAVRVSETFLDKNKLIVYTKGRKFSQNLEFISRANSPYTTMPMAILINEGSASGSEIVAGALQDHKRALIVGAKSFGKGSVQTVLPLGDGSALRLTTSKYFTPLGREIHGKGVMPDVVVEEMKIQTGEKPQDNSKNPQAIFEEIDEKSKPKENKTPDYKTDNQLMRAVDMLKALKIYSICPNEEKK